VADHRYDRGCATALLPQLQEAHLAHVSTTVITVIAGPLNYLGANPKVNCKVPEPSK
jgi:hypothetical protein